MSIRLMLDGHNFSRLPETLKAAGPGSGGRAVVMLDTPKTVLVPAYLYEKGVEEAYLRFNGLQPSERERMVSSEKQGEIVALMAADTSVLDAVEMKYDSVVYSSPLLEIASGKKRDVNIFLTQRNAYVAVWDKGLRFAEVLPDPSADSVLYYLQVLGREFRLKKFNINIGGEGSSGIVAAASDYFKHVKQAGFCE